MPDDFQPLSQVGQQQDDFQPLGGPGAGETSKTASAPQGEKSGWLQAIKSAALPTLGGIGGAALGGMAAGPSIAGVPLGVLTGEMAGAGLGEKANQWLGITKPSNLSVAASALSAPVGRAIGPVLKGLGGQVVKTVAGRDIMSEAATDLLKKWLNPTIPATQLFKQAEQSNLQVVGDEVFKVSDDILNKEMKRIPTNIRQEIIDAIKPIRDFFRPTTPPPQPTAAPTKTVTPIVMGKSGVRGMAPTTPATPAVTQAAAQPISKVISVPEMMEEEQRLRLLASKAYDSDNTKLANSINSVRNAMLTALDNSGAPEVRQASKAYRKEMALENLSRLLGKPHPSQKITDYMSTDKLFQGAFDKGEKEQIMRIARKLNYIPPSGGSGVAARAIETYAGLKLGGVPGAIAGLFGPDAVRAILMHPWGRNVAERILAGKSTLDHPTAAALATFARGMMAAPPQEQQ